MRSPAREGRQHEHHRSSHRSRVGRFGRPDAARRRGKRPASGRPADACRTELFVGGSARLPLSSLRHRAEQVDEAVELPERIRRITGRGANAEEAVDLLWAVTVRDIPSVRAYVELIHGRADR